MSGKGALDGTEGAGVQAQQNDPRFDEVMRGLAELREGMAQLMMRTLET